MATKKVDFAEVLQKCENKRQNSNSAKATQLGNGQVA